MRPRVVANALVQAFVRGFQGALFQGLTAAGAQQITDELQRLTAQSDDAGIHAHLVAGCPCKGIDQQQWHIGARLGVERGQVAVDARKTLRQQVGDFIVVRIGRGFQRLQQLFNLRQVHQQVVFECASQDFGQGFATQIDARGFTQGFQVVQESDDHIDHALAIGLRDLFRDRQSVQDFFNAGVQTCITQAVGAFEHPAQGLADVIGHGQNLRATFFGGNRVGQTFQNGQAVADQAQEHHLTVVRRAVCGFGGFGANCGCRGCRWGRGAGSRSACRGCIWSCFFRSSHRLGGRCRGSGNRQFGFVRDGQGLALTDHFEGTLQLGQQGGRLFSVAALGHGLFAQDFDVIERAQQQVHGVFVERGGALADQAQQIFAAVGDRLQCAQLHDTAQTFEGVKSPEQPRNFFGIEWL